LHLLFIPSSMPTASYIFSLHDALPIFDRIFAAQMKASAADLLGQYRSLHRENGERVRRHDGDEQRHESIEVMRQFQNEDDRSEWDAHGAPENRSHTDQWPEAQAFERKEHRLNS